MVLNLLVLKYTIRNDWMIVVHYISYQEKVTSLLFLMNRNFHLSSFFPVKTVHYGSAG